jgi:phosphate transport system substrate-binding protein
MEEQSFMNKKMKLRVSTIARDAIAFITHNENPDTISYEFVLRMLNGDIRTWKDWSTKLKNKPLQLVFDNASSSTVRFMTGLTRGKLGGNVYAAGDNQKVIDYIKTHPNAIGIIGLNWISDGRDQTTGSFYEGFRVMAINPADSSKHRGTYFKPYQAYLLYEAYPFFRNVYAINGEPRDGLGTGFVSHLCSQKGQTVVQQGGLLPMSQKAWIREVEINKNNPIP